MADDGAQDHPDSARTASSSDESPGSAKSAGGKGQRRAPRIPTEERLTRQALAYLERYATSLANLRLVLERKVSRAARHHGTDASAYAPMIEAVLDKCSRSGLVNDRSFAETKLASLRRKGASTRKIAAQLGAKGVARQMIDAVLDQDETSDASAARRFAQRRRLGPWRKGHADENPETRRDKDRKDMAAMCRAGHSISAARAALQDVEAMEE
ncbi:RecX family transcriptional regulator [Pannonibacter sp. Pt2]|uniref:Regulatory protein RecX n=1 Tax=Pannonibacter anstelovis TaxID=3121537 RepID=A0ABU7ZHX8_9HYPH